MHATRPVMARIRRNLLKQKDEEREAAEKAEAERAKRKAETETDVHVQPVDYRLPTFERAQGS